MVAGDNKNGDFRDWLVKQAMAAVRRIANRLGASQEVVEDAIDILTVLFLKKFPTASAWESVQFPAAYLNQSARHALWRAFRQAAKRKRLLLWGAMNTEEVEHAFLPPTELRQRDLTEDEIWDKVRRGLEALTRSERRAIGYQARGFSASLIARFLETSIQTVYTLLSTARKKLRKIWRDSA